MSPPEGGERARTAKTTETAVLVGTRRRCALCYGLSGDLSVKAGQIAHVDRDPSNSSEKNLAFLCLEHHDQYDSKTSQSKGLTPEELRMYRSALEDAVRAALSSAINPQDLPVSTQPAAAYRLGDDSLFIPGGYASPYFATEGDAICELSEPRVLIVGRTLNEMHEVLPIFEQAARAKTALLVVADGFSDGVLSTMIANRQKNVLSVCAITLSGSSRQETRRAIAQFSGATVLGDEAGRAVNSATLRDLGRVGSVRADVRSAILKAVHRDGKVGAPSTVAAPSHHQDLDRQIFDRLLEILPWDGSMAFVRHYNFAGFSFRISDLDDLSTFRSACEDPAFEFVDAELEVLRTALLDAVKRFDRLIGAETFPTHQSGFNTVPSEWEVDQPERFWRVVDDIHASTTDICDSYDRLVRTARRKVGILTGTG